jgi:hypothetical protein
MPDSHVVKPHDPDHHDHERIVELLCVPSIVEAQAILAQLHGQGIKAMTSTDDVGGQRPSLTFAQGYSVLVFEHDLERAKQLLTDLGLS